MSDEMDEIWALYADDGAQALDAMETALSALDQPDCSDAASHIAALFRAIHTFKGNSRVLGLATVESRAHLAEDLIGLVRDQGVPLDQEIRDILLMTADVLRDMLEQTERTRADVDPGASEDLMVQLRDKIARALAGADPAVQAPPPPVPDDGREDAPDIPVRDTFDELPTDVSSVPADAMTDPATETGVTEGATTGPDLDAPMAMLRRIDDPLYRKIFVDMADDTRQRLRAALASPSDETRAAARRGADNLSHAARQMDLPAWAEAVDRFLKLPAPDGEQIAALLLELDDCQGRDLGTPQPAQDTGNGFLARIWPDLGKLAALGAEFSPETDHAARRADVIGAIVQRASAEGLIRVAEATQALLAVTDRQAFRDGELRLYEELAAVESATGEVAPDASPRALLYRWCADHVFESLGELSVLLDALRNGGAHDANYSRFNQLMRRIHHACQHYHMDTAGQLAMSLLDLFARQQTRGGAPDPILEHIAQGFISTIELVLDSLEDGQEVLQTDTLQKLFAEASSVAFVAEGVVSAAAIERKLGLPREFHRVLSPESVRAAADALDAGLHFHVIRADINDDDRLAEAFVLWLGQNRTRSITNVTVFRGAETLFDFLIATPLSHASVVEALAHLDPSGTRLHCTQTLTADQSDLDLPEAAQALPPVAGISTEMLERIGEIATGQAMIHHMQKELAEIDMAGEIDNRLKAAGVAPDLRAEIRGLLGGVTEQQRDILQLEGPLLAQMAILQEETAALRSRPAEIVLQPIAALVKAQAAKAGRKIAVSTLGGDLSLDVTILETLRNVLRALALHRVGGPTLPGIMRLIFRHDRDCVHAMIEDDEAALIAPEFFRPLDDLVRQAQGRLRQVQIPGGGTRLHVTLPLSMVVIDGMVVRIGSVRYVLPVNAISLITQEAPGSAFTISASGGRSVLQLASRDLVPVCRIGTPVQQDRIYVILTVADCRVAIPVDEVLGQQLVLLRPLRGVLSRLEQLNGIALLAGGEVGLVISTAALEGESADVFTPVGPALTPATALQPA